MVRDFSPCPEIPDADGGGNQHTEADGGNCPLVVRLGYFHSISSSPDPSMVEEVYRLPENKQIRFHFTEDTSFDILHCLKSGKLDLAFCTHRDEWADSITIMKQPLYLAVPFEHPLSERSSVTFEDFAREPLVMLDKGQATCEDSLIRCLQSAALFQSRV